MKDLLPFAAVGLIAYLFYTGKASSIFSVLSNAASTLPPQRFSPGEYTGPPVSPNVMEANLSPEAQVIQTRAILQNQPGNVPEDTQLVFASYERHWANQLGGGKYLTFPQWNTYRSRYVAAYGGEDPSPGLTAIGVSPTASMSASDYLSKVNEWRSITGRPSLGGYTGGMGCAGCGGHCGHCAVEQVGGSRQWL